MIRRALSDAERLDWLRLIRTENVGPVTFHRLLERYGSADAALRALPDLAHRGGRTKPLRIATRSDAARELDAVGRVGARLIAACEPDYPPALAMIDDAPPLISIMGHAHLLKKAAIGIVGARNASVNGRRFAERLAVELGEAGLLVVSGLARGIDAAAHSGALATGTAAVVAGGVDIIYPEENAELYRRIAEAGVIVAESMVGVQPQARHFPRRNRLISGLSLGVVVVEAALRSGSLITARMALDQGRDVFAVPGSPMDPRAGGPNDLIRQGAVLTESAADVLGALADVLRAPMKEPERGFIQGGMPGIPSESELNSARYKVLECLSPTPVPVDELIRGCQLSASVVLTVLLELEIAGRVQRQPGNQFNLL